MGFALAAVQKDDPGSSDVHVNGTEWGGRRKKPSAPNLGVVTLEPDTVPAIGGVGKAGGRSLHAIGNGKTAKSPFLYDPNVLGTLRPDQVPRFFGALTDGDKLPTSQVDLSDLHAMQDRVDPAKVEAIRGEGAATGKKAVVIRHDGRDYIADGHHRLTAAWLDGKDTADVHYKDLEPVSQMMKSGAEGEGFESFFKVSGVDEGLGLVFGWGIVCKEGGVDYYDVQKNHIPEDAMVEAVTDFMKSARVHGDMHVRGTGPELAAGMVVHSFPLTTDIAKAMGIETTKTGWMVATAPDKAMLAKFKSGEYTGFSIGGDYIEINGQPVGTS